MPEGNSTTLCQENITGATPLDKFGRFTVRQYRVCNAPSKYCGTCKAFGSDSLQCSQMYSVTYTDPVTKSLDFITQMQL